MLRFTLVALVLAVALATVVSPFASPAPDGLERVAADSAFLDRGRAHPIQEDSPVPDYAVPGVADARAATGLAGLAGTVVVFAAGLAVAAVVRRRT